MLLGWLVLAEPRNAPHTLGFPQIALDTESPAAAFSLNALACVKSAWTSTR